MMPPLPRQARWSMRWLMSAENRQAALADLEELYQHRRAREGSAAADAWLRRQSSQYSWRLLGHPEPMRTLLNDARQSLRSLARTPVLAGTIVLTVGLGIGATTAIFGVVHAVLIKPLPYPDAHELVNIYTDAPPNKWRFSVVDWRAVEQRHEAFSQVAGYTSGTATFSNGDVTDRLQGRAVTWQYFSMLGIRPLHGRDFTTADSALSAPPTVILGYRFWRSRLGGDPAIVGQTVRLDGRAHQVIGILPPLDGPFERYRDYFTAAQWQAPRRRGPFMITALGRLRADSARANAELASVSRDIFPVWRSSYQDERARFTTQPLKHFVIRDIGKTLLIVMGAMGFVLLIACTNAANLLVARTTQRARELAVRQALGATRARLLQHLLTESALLATGAAIVAVIVATLSIDALAAASNFIPRTGEIGMSPAIAGFLALLVAGSAVLFGLVPASGLAGGRLDQMLRSSSRSATHGSHSRAVRRALVLGQFAVATPLLIAAGLLIGSLGKLQQVDPGFQSANLLTGTLRVTQAQYPDTSDVRQFFERLTARLAAVPGVRTVAWSNSLPPNNANDINNFDLEDYPTPPDGAQPVAPWIRADTGYFRAMGIELVKGRLFERSDFDAAAPGIIVVDEAWAQRYFPGQEVLGRRLRSGGCTDCDWTTVVGVVRNVKYRGLGQDDVGAVYDPFSPYEALRFLVLRTEGRPEGVLPAVRRAVQEADPSLVLADAATGSELVAGDLVVPRYLSLLVGAFALLALLLSVIGIYGVMAFFVQEHTRDIGIRIALGGGPARVVKMVVGQGMSVVALGVVIGVAAAFALTRFMRSMLFEVGATDPMTFAAVPLLMLFVALTACLLPARRAARLDPVMTLRDD